MRIEFSTWGCRGPIKPIGDGFAVTRFDESATETVGRSIARRTGLDVCNMRQDHWEQRGGKVVALIYEVTLGRPVQGGGHSVEGSLWVKIPKEAG